MSTASAPISTGFALAELRSDYTIPTPEDNAIAGADAAEVALNGRVRSWGTELVGEAGIEPATPCV